MSMQDTLQALADPTRREILNLLKQSRMSAGEISNHFSISGAAVSRHLSVLKEADLIRDEREGKYIYYELNATVLEEILLWISELKGEDDYDQTTLIKNTGNTDDAGTTVLNAATKVERHPYLYQVKNGRKIYLDKKTNRIGKNREVVDICIDGNPAISRCHAIFYRVDDACYIEDLNSTNGTFVDDQQITSNCKTMVRVGSRVKLGDEEFELRYD